MPTLRQYQNDEGYYVVATQQRRPMTYQLTSEGTKYLTQDLKLNDRSHFDGKELRSLIERGWAFADGATAKKPLAAEVEADAGKLDLASQEAEQEHTANLERHIKIRLESADLGELDSVVSRMVQAFRECGAKIAGPIPLPTRVEKYQVVSRPGLEEHRVYSHRRILTLLDPPNSAVHRAATINVPAGVDVKVREFETIRPLHERA